MKKYRSTKYLRKKLLENITKDFFSKEIIFSSEKKISRLLIKTKNNKYSYNILERGIFEKQVDEIIQYQSWKVLEDFYATQFINDEISIEKQQKLKNYGIDVI